MHTITFLGDWIAPDFTDEDLWNRYLTQNIEINFDQQQEFTVHPQIDSASFRFFTNELQFHSFDEFTFSHNIVIIGLHGGWNIDKLTKITKWFNKDAKHLKPWFDKDTKIVLDYSEEGFTTEVFADVYNWIREHRLEDRILYVSSTHNVEQVYHDWCRQYRLRPNMRTAWYGFFVNWIIRDRAMCRRTNTIQQAGYTPGKPRFMCLNRRPYPHRILLTTLLERHRLLDQGAVSMPKHFEESGVAWKPEDFDIPYQWDQLRERYNGMIDYLDTDFASMYSKLPLVADTDNFGTNRALDLNDDFYSNYPINLVTETLFFTDSVFASEKIWKPMLMGQIFIVMAAPNFLNTLRILGFKTFHPFINEEYDEIIDPLERSEEIVKTMVRINRLTEEDFARLLDNCRPIIEHNRSLIMDRNRIEELVSKDLVQAIEGLWD
jgi:hypothetical protein